MKLYIGEMKRIQINILILFSITLLVSCTTKTNETQEVDLLTAYIIDGSNNHYVWPKTSLMMKSYLEETDLFDVEIKRFDSLYRL